MHLSLWKIIQSNSPEDWALAAGAGILLFLIVKVAQVFAVKRLRAGGRHSQLMLAAGHAFDQTKNSLLLIITLHWGASTADLTVVQNHFIHTIYVVACFLQFGLWLHSISADITRALFLQGPQSAQQAGGLSALGFLAQVFVWLAIGILALDNIGVNVSALVTGLGISGIAVALAVQSVLGDLLASLAIMLDRPFVVGDLISVGSETGTVTNIGVKTTRLRSPRGEELVYSNSEILKGLIRNYQRMQMRSVSVQALLPETTPCTLLPKFCQAVEGHLRARPRVAKYDGCFFSQLNPATLRFDILFTLNTNDPAAFTQEQDLLLQRILAWIQENSLSFPVAPHA